MIYQGFLKTSVGWFENLAGENFPFLNQNEWGCGSTGGGGPGVGGSGGSFGGGLPWVGCYKIWSRPDEFPPIFFWVGYWFRSFTIFWKVRFIVGIIIIIIVIIIISIIIITTKKRHIHSDVFFSDSPCGFVSGDQEDEDLVRLRKKSEVRGWMGNMCHLADGNSVDFVSSYLGLYTPHFFGHKKLGPEWKGGPERCLSDPEKGFRITYG